MKKQLRLIALIMFLIIVVIAFTGAAFVCNHKETYTKTVVEASCTVPGQENVICCRCDAALQMHTIPATGHDWGEFVIITLPTKDTNGVHMRACYKCETREEAEYICRHYTEDSHIAIEPTCSSEGRREWACVYCETIVKQETIPMLECTWGEWAITRFATPFESGEKSRTCAVCNNTDFKKYTMSMAGQNAIYIPGSGINHVVSISSFTQWAVDKYDIVYTEEAMENGTSNPFILGHNTRTFGALPKTRVGQLIYLSINGKIEVYKVKVSEAAKLKSYGSDIIGNKTGASLWDTYMGKTLHMYTCYGSNGGRWLVLAQKIE